MNFTTSSPGHFAAALQRWTDVKVKGTARANTLALARGVYAAILVYSPVLTGRFRKNVKFGLNGINPADKDAPGSVPVVGSRPSGKEWGTSGYKEMRDEFKMGDTINISNSVKMDTGGNTYANKVEYEGWTSKGPYAPFGKAVRWASVDAARVVMFGKKGGGGVVA
jgi:hypothetical protein